MSKKTNKRYSNRKAHYAAILILSFNASVAQYEITKHSIDNGGETSTGANYQITGSIGQPDASASLRGGSYILAGGFWANGVDTDIIFKHGFE